MLQSFKRNRKEAERTSSLLEFSKQLLVSYPLRNPLLNSVYYDVSIIKEVLILILVNLSKRKKNFTIINQNHFLFSFLGLMNNILYIYQKICAIMICMLVFVMFINNSIILFIDFTK